MNVPIYAKRCIAFVALAAQPVIVAMLTGFDFRLGADLAGIYMAAIILGAAAATFPFEDSP